MLAISHAHVFGGFSGPIDDARGCIRGAGSFASCTAGLSPEDVAQLAQEFPAQASSIPAPTIDTARICIRGTGSFASCTAGLPQSDIDQLAKEFPQAAPASAKKFFDIKNPMMWLAIGGGVVGVVAVGAVLKGSHATKAMGRRRRR